MNNLLKYSVIILLTILFTETTNSQNDYMKNRFTIGTYNKVMNLELRRPQDLLNYNNLNFNINLSFTYRGDDNPDNRYVDGFFTNSSYYLPTYQSTLFDLFSNPNISEYNKQKVYFERAKIIRGALGQRSTYQAENHGTYQDKYPGYGYNYSQTGMDYADDPDNNGIVAGRRCITGNHSAGYMVYGLYENMEQIDHPKRDNSGKTSMEYFWSDNKDEDYFWVVKPRMRIKVEDFNDPNKKEMNVVRIDIVGYLYPLDPIYIKVKDFGDYFQNYNGVYKEDFYTYITEFNYTPILKVLAINLLKNMPDFDNSNKDAILQASQVDYKVYWCGNVDVWLDYVRLDDKWAHFLFTDPGGTATGNDLNFHRRIHDEVTDLLPSSNSPQGFGYFYVDEYCYNNIPCIAEVNRLVQNLNSNTGVVAMDNEFAIDGLDELRNKPYFGIFYDTLLSSKAVTDILVNECYPFDLLNGPDKHFVKYPKTVGTNFPAGLAAYVSGLYRQADDDEQYNEGINYKLEQNYPYYFLGIHRKSADLVKKARQQGKNITYSISIQNHVFEQNLGKGWTDEYGLRDVTNEEVSMQSYLALTYGAKQIMDYCYHSDPPIIRTKIPYNGTYFNNGIIDINGNAITTNYFGQPKFQFLCSLNTKLRQIGEIMYPTDQPEKHLILDNSRTINTVFQNYHTEYTCGLPFKYISDILSIYPDPNGSFLDNNTDPSEKRYWEVGTFLPPSSIFEEKFSKYFIMLNKRCTPPKENVSYGDVRHLKIKFDPNELPGFNNWVLIDPLTNNVITAINKNSGTYYYAGEFQPGEGRLFKLAPVMQEGGTFVCDEEVLGQSFVCKGMVESGQYNLSIENSQINFKPQGQLKAYNYSDAEPDVSIINSLLKGKDNGTWYGLEAYGLYSIYIANSTIQDIMGGWAVNIINCDNAILSGATINVTTANAGAFVMNNGIGTPTAIIWDNTITTKSYTAAVALVNSSGSNGYASIFNNNITTTENGNMGILTTNCSGEIERNTLNNYNIGINAISCNFDLTGNTLLSSRNNSQGINASVNSMLYLNNYGDVALGSDNTITNSGTSCININVDNSAFFADAGYNKFNVGNLTTDFNFYGIWDDNSNQDVYVLPVTLNCFNGPGGTAKSELRSPRWILYELQEIPYYCESQNNEDMLFAYTVSENFVDTVYKSSGFQYSNLTEKEKLYRNFLINYIKKDYDSVIIKGNYLLSNNADSVYAPEIISKLHHSVSMLDTAGERIQPLKTYFEQLIINNPDNPGLVKSAYYHIQKCKVYLEQYQSALAGFEDIIAQNPYGYEGLLASWDYAATLLLMDTIGAGGMSNKSELNEYFSETNTADFTVDSLRSKRLTKYDNYDKSVFTPNDRKTIIQNTATIFAEQRNKQIEKVKELENKVSKSDGVDATRNKTELASMKALNEVVKIKRAKDQPDYMRLVTDDVNKVFKNTSDAGINKTNVIPTSFELHQNYPNPFNPSTKIAFDLPKDAKVKLVIYDILGREIKTLIHNEFRAAGKYITEFNGSNLASGVYFYRLQAGDFVSVKKMVLIK